MEETSRLNLPGDPAKHRWQSKVYHEINFQNACNTFNERPLKFLTGQGLILVIYCDASDVPANPADNVES